MLTDVQLIRKTISSYIHGNCIKGARPQDKISVAADKVPICIIVSSRKYDNVSI